jgi:hypothetical protein
MTSVSPFRSPSPPPPAGGAATAVPPRLRLPGLALLDAQPTPRTLVLALIAILVCTALLLAAAASSAVHARGAMQTVGHTAAPAIAADEDISFALADMDAQAANWLLVGRRALGSTEADAGAAYYRDRDLATRNLIAASFTTGDAARGPIGSVLTGLTTYHGYALQAELLADQGDSRAALGEYRLATDLMHHTLLPAMASVTAINVRSLDDAYAAQQPAAVRDIALVVLLGLLLLAVLVAVQRFLLRRTRRILNPGLLGATVAALLLTVGATTTLGGVAGDLHGAKQDAFDSVLALSSARATAYDANSDRSGDLLDGFRAPAYESSFLAKSLAITGLPHSTTAATFDTALAASVKDAAGGTVSFGGYLGTAFDNLTFPGERDAALVALRAYQQYQLDERQLLAMAAGRKSGEAIAYATSVSHGSSGYDFQQFDSALQRVVGIDQAYLAAFVSESDGRLSPWTYLPPVAAAVIVVLAVAGLWPRLREYQGR